MLLQNNSNDSTNLITRILLKRRTKFEITCQSNAKHLKQQRQRPNVIAASGTRILSLTLKYCSPGVIVNAVRTMIVALRRSLAYNPHARIYIRCSAPGICSGPEMHRAVSYWVCTCRGVCSYVRS